MGGHPLEWSVCPNSEQGEWTPLDISVDCSNAEVEQGWYLPRFHTWIGQRFVSYQFDVWCSEQLDVAAYNAKGLHQAQHGASYSRVYVREIPRPLLLTCAFSHMDRAVYDVVFITMAGETVLRTRQQLCFWPLARDVARAAVIQGRLQSCNQQVCVLLENCTEPLPRFCAKDFDGS